MHSGRGGFREGAGRPKGTTRASGAPTKVFRLSAEVTKEQYEAVTSVLGSLADWRAKCEANPKGARYWFLREMLKELEKYGY